MFQLLGNPLQFYGFIPPLLLFRWMFLVLLSLMPWTWLVGLRKLGMTRLEVTLVSLCVYSIHSWRKFGLELSAFQHYGLFTQAYGMAIFPLAAGFLYEHVLYGLTSRSATVLLVALNFIAHSFFGIYLGIVTGVTLVVDLFTNPLPFKRKLCSPSILRACSVHFLTVALLSWWIFPLLANFKYVGGLPWKNEDGNGYKAEFIFKKLFSGELFDYERKVPFITTGVLAGSQLQQINSFLSLTEIHEMPEGLNEMKSYRSNGRVLAQKVLGTGDPLSLALLPHYSKKPELQMETSSNSSLPRRRGSRTSGLSPR